MPVLALLTAAACDDPVSSEDVNLVVVEAFLFAGEPVDDIRLSSTVPLGEDPSLAPTIDDAEVRLLRGETVFELTARGDSGLYYYAGADLTVREGDLFRLEIDYFGRTAFGETIVPGPPVNVATDGDTLFAPTLGFGRGGGTADPQNQGLSVTWDNPSQLLHFVVVQGLDEDAEPIFPEQFQERLGQFRLITEPTSDTFFDITLLMLRDLGSHDAIVYRVNEEYSALYENRTQDSRDLNEPPSNMTDGIGIFSAFNSVTRPFQVARDDGTS